MKSLRIVVGIIAASLSDLSDAQSSVTLTGKVDNGLTFVSREGGSNNAKVDSGVLFPNVWNLKGEEDLGGGNKTLFTLSSIFNLNNGQVLQPNTEFGRQAWVGLQTNYGTLTLGKQWDFSAEYFAQFSVSVIGSGYAIHQGDFDRSNNDRLTNSVKYTSPTFKGFSFGAMYGFSNIPGRFHDESGWSTGAQYSNGPLTIGAAYTYKSTPTLNPYAQIGTRTFFDVPVAVASGNTVTNLQPDFQIQSLGTFGVGAAYEIGTITFYGDFSDTVLKYNGVSSAMHVYETGVTYLVFPTLSVVLGYQHTAFQGNSWNQLTAAASYFLSKRSQIYVSSDYLKASSGVDPVIGASFTPSVSHHQADIRVGILQVF